MKERKRKKDSETNKNLTFQSTWIVFYCCAIIEMWQLKTVQFMFFSSRGQDYIRGLLPRVSQGCSECTGWSAFSSRDTVISKLIQLVANIHFLSCIGLRIPAAYCLLARGSHIRPLQIVMLFLQSQEEWHPITVAMINWSKLTPGSCSHSREGIIQDLNIKQ